MTLAINESEKRRPGRPKGSGSGKTHLEKIERAKRNFAVEQTEIELSVQRSQLAELAETQRRKEERQARVNELYARQEARRAPQAQVDQAATLITLIFLGAITFIATAVLTADGTIAAAELARFEYDWMGFVLFGAVEVAILGFMLMYYVKGSRVGYDGKPVAAAQWFVAMVFAATITVGLSIYHVMDVYDFDWENFDMWVGVVIRFVVSFLFVLVSKGLASTIFARAIQP